MESELDWYETAEFLPLGGELVIVLGLEGLWEAIEVSEPSGWRYVWWQEGRSESTTTYDLWADVPTEVGA